MIKYTNVHKCYVTWLVVMYDHGTISETLIDINLMSSRKLKVTHRLPNHGSGLE